MTDLLTVLVTRAEPGATQTTNRLKQNGFLGEKMPAIKLTQTSIVFNQQHYKGALVFTSQNGVQFAPRAPFRHAKQVFCVGDATAQAARQAGFKNVHSARGDANDLKQFIRDNWKPNSGPLLHMGNSKPRGNIVQNLSSEGYDAEFLPVYQSKIHPDFEEKFRLRLQMDLKLDVILVHSPMAAEFIDLALQDWSQLSSITLPKVVAISPDAGNPLKDLFNEKVICAAKPNEISLLEQLKVS